MVVQLLRPCMVCDSDVKELTVTEGVPVLTEDEGSPGLVSSKGWTARVYLCKGCSGTLGTPVEWIQYWLVNYAVFASSDKRVELKGAPCFSDD